jgi:hypothetical protein
VEGGESDDRSDRSRLFHRKQRADLAPERRIAGDNSGRLADSGEIGRKLFLEQRSGCIVDGPDKRLASVQRSDSQRPFA